MKLPRATVLTLVVALSGCVSQFKAPVIERTVTRQPVVAPPTRPAASAPPAASEAPPDTYTVKRGDTLYSIALDNGLDYRELADWNEITNPAAIQAGQVLRLRPQQPSAVEVRPATTPGSVEVRPIAESARAGGGDLKTEPKAMKLPYSEQNVALLLRQPQLPPQPKPELQPATPGGAYEEKLDWSWPASGRVLAGFSDGASKGVDIVGKIGDPVYASASGRVVYSGTGLRGYGKLVIIKHNQTYLSAYAHNNSILVKEGQKVVKGQKIAEIGKSDADQAKLHFEIRRLGKPVDPLKFLPERRS